MLRTAAGNLWLKLYHREDGQGLVEWSLILALVVIVSVFVLKMVGIDVFNSLDGTEDSLPADPAPIGTDPTAPTGF